MGMERRGLVSRGSTRPGTRRTAMTPYDIDLDRNAANFQPLTPLSFLERAAAVFPDQTAIIHGALRRSYAQFYVRARQLASALARRRILRGVPRLGRHAIWPA